MSDEYSLATKFLLGQLNEQGYRHDLARLMAKQDDAICPQWESPLNYARQRPLSANELANRPDAYGQLF